MSGKAIVVMGGGNTGFSMAAKFSLEGHEVVLWETPSHEASLAPLKERRQIRLTGDGGAGLATLTSVTTNPFEALASGDVLLASVPSYAHAPFAELLLPLLEPRHVLALLPGNFGSLAYVKWLGSTAVTLRASRSSLRATQPPMSAGS